jgi:hypothetical protein
MLNTVVVAPIPSASVRIATELTIGFRAVLRRPIRKSRAASSIHGALVDTSCRIRRRPIRSSTLLPNPSPTNPPAGRTNRGSCRSGPAAPHAYRAHNSPILEHKHLLCAAHRREPVTNNERRATARKRAKTLLDQLSELSRASFWSLRYGTTLNSRVAPTPRKLTLRVT